MAQRNRPNIFIVKRPRADDFTSFAQPVPQRVLHPRPDPKIHAMLLTQQLQNASMAAVDLKNATTARITGAKDGFYVEFASPPFFELKWESLANKPQQIELLNVRRSLDGEQLATVFIPDGALQHFLDRFAEYTLPIKPGKKNRSHRALVESLAAIRLAAVNAIWTDDPASYPKMDESIWWEIWLRVRDGHELNRFHEYAARFKITVVQDHLRFVDRIVLLAHASPVQLSESVIILDDLAELRRAKDTPTTFIEMEPVEEAEWVKEYLARIEPPAENSPAVCVLDTGATQNHPLLEAALTESDCHSYNATWKTTDHQGHGTAMCGLALYGNLTPAFHSTDKTSLKHRLESVKILPPKGENDERLYGSITAHAMSLPEITAPNRQRVFSLAVTAPRRPEAKPDTGLPSSWSAALDALAMGRQLSKSDLEIEYVDEAQEGSQRLIVVSAGNIRDGKWPSEYLDLCDTSEIESPAQAWNVLTVGGFTDLTSINPHDKNWDGWIPVAPGGDLSPHSRTSLLFDKQWPLKPDVVHEAGNVIQTISGSSSMNHDDLCLLTTFYQPNVQLLSTSYATSAATAQVARIAAQIMAADPNLWPETVRALIVHSARWTPRMMECFNANNKTERQQLVRRYGFGVPDAARAIQSALNAVSLVFQGKIKPFANGKMQEMHLHELPWPKAVLEALGSTTVRMRVTLSYFIEPYPARRGWRHRHRYASHALRFEVKLPEDDVDRFVKTINKEALEEDEERPETETDEGWFLGKNSQKKGSIHSDMWEGSAADLASRGVIAIVPRSGWWKERKELDRSAKGVRYALVVSIETDEEKVDLWTPIAQQVGIPITTAVTI